MIMPRTSAAANVWHRSGMIWFAALGIWAIEVGIIELQSSRSYISWPIFLAVWLNITAVLWFIGRNRAECQRVIIYAVVFGVLGCLPMLLVLVTGGFSFFILAGFLESTKIFLSLVAACFIGAVLQFLLILTRIRKSRLVEKKFLATGSSISVRRNIELEDGEHNSLMPRISDAAVAAMPVICIATYFFQSGIARFFGPLSVPLLLSVISLPWAIRAAGQYLGGIYLWVYVPLRLESKERKPVIFRT